ncbi:MAG: tetratricopeptide repeat protein [Saprospiraceae bacterium]|nr:tetratricopeptide repeat protein [Saprospiraceae bacterium]
MKYLHVNIFCLSILWMNTVIAQSTHTPLRKGDRAYDRELYKAAEKEYRTAADRDMGNPQAVYNLGNTLYQQGKFEDAEERFLQVTNHTKTPAHRADALHNLGNAFLKQRKYKEAVRAYEESLRVCPADLGAKQNLQMAKKKLQEEEQKDKEKQQQKQQQEQDQQNQNQDQPPPQNTQDQQDQQQNQPNQSQQNPQGQPRQPQNEQQKKQEEQRLKKEDAKRLLETAVGPDDRKNAQKYRAAQQQSKPKGSKKDW